MSQEAKDGAGGWQRVDLRFVLAIPMG